MSTLNYLCQHDVSDDDCYKCTKHGIVFRCPTGCPDFDDVRKGMPKEMLEERERLMKQLGVTDTIKFGDTVSENEHNYDTSIG